MKLKNMLLKKFMAKYQPYGVEKTDGLETFVMEQLERIFTARDFNEKDLVAVDRSIRSYIKEKRVLALKAAEAKRDKEAAATI